ncbi:hypothetical protein [Chryseobacterium luteum]|nr:hypothetical protein [Chryseobacterium luteum]
MLKIKLYEDSSLIFIPHYDTNKYPFPPFENNPYYNGPKIEDNGTKRRINAFLEEPLIFFEDNERSGQTFKILLDYKIDNFDIKKFHLIHCIDTETYTWIYKTLRKDFLYYETGQSFNRENTIHNEALRYIEKKLIDLKDDLPNGLSKKIFSPEGLL